MKHKIANIILSKYNKILSIETKILSIKIRKKWRTKKIAFTNWRRISHILPGETIVNQIRCEQIFEKALTAKLVADKSHELVEHVRNIKPRQFKPVNNSIERSDYISTLFDTEESVTNTKKSNLFIQTQVLLSNIFRLYGYAIRILRKNFNAIMNPFNRQFLSVRNVFDRCLRCWQKNEALSSIGLLLSERRGGFLVQTFRFSYSSSSITAKTFGLTIRTRMEQTHQQPKLDPKTREIFQNSAVFFSETKFRIFVIKISDC